MGETRDPRDESLTRLLGDRTAKVLRDGLDLHTVGDLLTHYPRRYAERGDLTDLDELQPDEHVTVVAEISKVAKRSMRNRRGSLLEVTVTDGTGRLTLTFFNQAWRERDLVPGRRGLFSGKVTLFRGNRQLAHPDYMLLPTEEAPVDTAPHLEERLLAAAPEHGSHTLEPAGLDAASLAAEFTEALIPVYPATAAIPSWKVAQCVRIALDTLGPLDDPLPKGLRDRHDLLELRQALDQVHRPANWPQLKTAQRRLKWDEAFVLQVALAQRRHALRGQSTTARIAGPDGLLVAFDARLPFPLTGGQRAVGEQLAADLAATAPMHRLLQGDVGSGKTVVALRAMLTVVDAGGQAVLLAPTEVLAQQHHRSIVELLGPLAGAGTLGAADQATGVELLTGSLSVKERRRVLLAVASGQAGIVVGTHALLQDPVSFFDLGLVVVDEQHRFGVEQRDALRSKAGQPPHTLVMTATPIPRTVAMTVFGDLDVSTLTELPAGRSPIATHTVPTRERPDYLERAWQRIREEVTAGHQAYVVCPRIGEADGPDTEESAAADVADEPADPESGGERRPPLAVAEVAPMLVEGPLAGLRTAVLHGRLPPEEKDRVMRAFAAGEVDVLVATTVVEVGVNVPNATVMVIADADRFGVSQLHQLRGRVGRGSAPGLCLLVTEAPAGSPARARLDAVAATLDGFELSRVDLEQRREGDVLGAAQSGRRSSLRMLAVIRDEDVIRAARQEAGELVATDPELELHPELRRALDSVLDAQRAEYLEKT